MLSAEIEIANRNPYDVTKLPAGTYTAQDVHEHKLFYDRHYLEGNECHQSLTKIMKIDSGWYTAPIGNIYYLIYQHEKAAGVKPYVWKSCDQRQPKVEFYLTFPPKSTMLELYEVETFDNEDISYVGISLKRGAIYWTSISGDKFRYSFKEKIPTLSAVIAQETDGFMYIPSQYKYIYGRCKVSIRYHTRPKNNHLTNNPYKVSVTIENEDGMLVSSETMLPSKTIHALHKRSTEYIVNSVTNLSNDKNLCQDK